MFRFFRQPQRLKRQSGDAYLRASGNAYLPGAPAQVRPQTFNVILKPRSVFVAEFRVERSGTVSQIEALGGPVLSVGDITFGHGRPVSHDEHGNLRNPVDVPRGTLITADIINGSGIEYTAKVTVF